MDCLRARLSGWAFGFLGGAFLVVWGAVEEAEEILWVGLFGVGEGEMDLVCLVMVMGLYSVLFCFRRCFHWWTWLRGDR
jgi:hypothetical protein